MKRTLPKESAIIKSRLAEIMHEIMSVAEDQISKVILFGSFAKGDWVNDRYYKDRILYSYESDIDILLVLKSAKNCRYQAMNIEDAIFNRLEKRNVRKNPWVTFITESLKHVNEMLAEGQYFFSDVKTEGILLYSDGQPLADKKDLSNLDKRRIAQQDYDCWFNAGSDFLAGVEFYIKQQLNLNIAVFMLHQATESFYNTLLLVFTGYKPKLHDLSTLRTMTNLYSEELPKIFTFDTKLKRRCFDLLQRAYVEARYSKHYTITIDQVEYLIERITELQKITKKICLEQIASYSD